MSHNETILTPNINNKYICKKCDFKCYKKSEWKRHIITRKHINETNETEMKQKISKNLKIYECDNCKDTFNSRTTLWRHKKKCSINEEKKEEQIATEVPTLNNYVDKELLKALIKNQETLGKLLEQVSISLHIK